MEKIPILYRSNIQARRINSYIVHHLCRADAVEWLYTSAADRRLSPISLSSRNNMADENTKTKEDVVTNNKSKNINVIERKRNLWKRKRERRSPSSSSSSESSSSSSSSDLRDSSEDREKRKKKKKRTRRRNKSKKRRKRSLATHVVSGCYLLTLSYIVLIDVLQFYAIYRKFVLGCLC